MTLERVYTNDTRAEDFLSPDSTNTGIPTGFLEFGNSIFLNPKPNYDAANGGKLFFERQQSYFTSSDTTKEPGIPKPFHDILAYIASLEWLIVYKPDNALLVNRIKEKLQVKNQQLQDLIDRRTPTVRRMATRAESNQ